MILVFGGTTEGRRAAEALDEAGTTYYYSTRGEGQRLQLAHGIQLTGGMDPDAMAACCREHGIRLIVDAAHPFASQLHGNILALCRATGLPVVRYERIYPPRDESLTWCADYAEAMRLMADRGVGRLLALTGVNTIARLKPYWQQHDCWFRILDRQTSHDAARQAGFPEERLAYYETDDTATLLRTLNPDAILTKESGESGGFSEKVAAAKAAGAEVFVVMRPEYDFKYVVDGPYGLRREVERLLPDFYPLHSGLTTGTCATAAAVAQAIRLYRQEEPQQVGVVLPDGETIPVAVGYGEGYAYAVKQSGDDPDVTDGLEVRVSLEPTADGTLTFAGGQGVGIITLPGFDYPPGSPAINKVPRQMIASNLSRVLPGGGLSVRVTVSIPGGEDVARRTFNPRLGIEGGISVIGVSGIVKPFSEEAFIDSIRKCMTIAKASGAARVVINSGAKSERYLKARYRELPPQAFVEYGNYVGETLRMASDMGFRQVTLGLMLGKAVKLAAGHLDTHSRRSVMDKAFVAQLLSEAGCPADISTLTLARELWQMIPQERIGRFVATVIAHCARYCRPLLPGGELTILLIDDSGNIYTGDNIYTGENNNKL